MDEAERFFGPCCLFLSKYTYIPSSSAQLYRFCLESQGKMALTCMQVNSHSNTFPMKLSELTRTSERNNAAQQDESGTDTDEDGVLIKAKAQVSQEQPEPEPKPPAKKRPAGGFYPQSKPRNWRVSDISSPSRQPILRFSVPNVCDSKARADTGIFHKPRSRIQASQISPPAQLLQEGSDQA